MSVSTKVDRWEEGSPVEKKTSLRPYLVVYAPHTRVSNVGSPVEKKTSLRPYLVVYAPHTRVSNVCEVKNVPLLFQNKECVWRMCSFDRGHCLPR